MAKKKRIIWENLNHNFGFYYTADETLYKGKSTFQKVEMVHTPEFGNTLLLDGITQVVEKNEWQYHEPMVHPSLCMHPRPHDVLVIGGGDGGILREVLKYKSVKNVHFAELDGKVIDFSRKYLSEMNQHSFDDPRVQIHITDGRKFVKDHPKSFDVVIMDMTDPFGPSRFLYTREFFRLVKKSFKDENGFFTMHSESPITRPVAFNCIYSTLKSVFTTVQPLYLYIQMYAVLWSISVCSDSSRLANSRPALVNKRLEKNGIQGLHVFTGETLEAMRTPYPYILNILKQKHPIITDKKPDFPDNDIDCS